MRILLIHPGSSYSTSDVWQGVHDGFLHHGAEVIDFAMDARLAVARHEMMWLAKHKPDMPKPNAADVLYRASAGALERAARFRPDWIVIVTAMFFHPDIIAFLRDAGHRVAALFTESPYDDEDQLKLTPCLNACWVNERASVAPFARVLPHTWYYQHAIDPQRHKPGAQPGDEDVPAHDVVFVGMGFVERIRLLESVDWSGIDLGLYGDWTLLGARSKLRKYIHGKLQSNSRTNALYRRAKLGMNMHRTSYDGLRETRHIEYAESMGPRCYELAAAGLPFVTDYRAEVGDVFGGLVPTFETGDQLRAILDGLLKDGQERARIAAALPACVAGHTFDNRARQMLAQLQEAE
jgi:hypothetical protein